MIQEEATIVLDCGNALCKAGYAGDPTPSVVLPTVIGIPRVQEEEEGHQAEYIGFEAKIKRKLLSLSNPLQNGRIANWDDMTKLWQHLLLRELRAKPEEHSVLLTEPPLNPKDFREKSTEIWFELFKVPSFFLGISSVLSLYALGYTTGLVLEIGDGLTHSVPVFGGYSLRHSTSSLQVSGHELTEYLIRLLHTERARSLHEPICGIPGYEITNDIKEKLCYVALNPEEEAKDKSIERTYKLPNGDTVTLGNERFLCPEALFKPSDVGQERGGIHERIFESTQNVEVDMRRSMYEHIVLAGGTCRFSGLKERLEKELKKLVPSAAKIKIFEALPDEIQWLPWCGGSVFASLNAFAENSILKEEYEESGPSIIKKTSQTSNTQ